MDMQTTAWIVLLIFLLIPPNNETTAYIQVIGSAISCSILLLNIDWVEVNELVKSYLNECVNWLLIKTDGDRTLAKTYFIMILVIAMQPIILGGFWLLKLYKKDRVWNSKIYLSLHQKENFNFCIHKDIKWNLNL